MRCKNGVIWRKWEIEKYKKSVPVKGEGVKRRL
jgi:hypothetical protein